MGGAKADFERSISLDKSYAASYANIAVLYHSRREYENAIEYLNQAIEYETANSEYFRLRGVNYSLLNCSEEALKSRSNVQARGTLLRARRFGFGGSTFLYGNPYPSVSHSSSMGQ